MREVVRMERETVSDNYGFGPQRLADVDPGAATRSERPMSFASQCLVPGDDLIALARPI